MSAPVAHAEPAPPEPRGGGAALAVLLLLLATCLDFGRPLASAPAGLEAPPADFSAARARATLRRLAPVEEPRPSGSEAHARFLGRLERELAELGLEPQLQETLAVGPHGDVAVVRNVLARLPGRRAGPGVLLCAHTDTVGVSPGAANDGAGVAALLETARALRAGPRPGRPVLLLFSDASEVGLGGASAFLREHPWAADFDCVVTLDARGGGGPSVLFEQRGADRALLARLTAVLPGSAATSAAEWVHKNVPADTDLSVLAAGRRGLGFGLLGAPERHHTPLDRLDLLAPASLQHHGENALACARALAAEPLPPRGPELDFADLAGRALVVWSPAWVTPLAALCVPLILGATALALRRRATGLRRLLQAAGAAALSFLAPLLVGGMLLPALARLRHAPSPALAHPAATRWLLFGASLALAVALAGPLARRAGARASYLAAGGALALGALLLAAAAPATAHLLLLPALLAALVAPLLPFLPARAAALLAFAPAALTAELWGGVYDAMEVGFGFARGALLGAALAPVALWLVPALARTAPRSARALALGAGAVALLALGRSLLRPIHDAAHPAPLNLRYVLDADARRARWDVSTYGLALPEPLRLQAGLAPSSEPPFPWLSLDRSLFVAPAPDWEVPPPSLAPLSTEQVEGGRLVRARFRSPRGAGRLHLHHPPEVELRAVRWRDHELRSGLGPGPSHIFYAVPPADGVELELFLPGERERELWLLDQDWAVPEEIRPLQALRPASRVPFADGDVSIVGRSVRL